MFVIDRNFVINNGNVQDALSCIYQWSNTGHIGLLISKCIALHLGAKNPEIPLIINNNALPVVREIRDLGIHIDNKLTFDGHTGNITARAYALVGQLLCTLRTKKK